MPIHMAILDFFFQKKLSSVLGKTHTVYAQGVKFKVRKLHPLDFLDGSKSVQTVYQTYEEARKKGDPDGIATSAKKIKEHYADVFLAAVVDPVLVRDEAEQETGIWVQNLFSDWDLCNDLYGSIMELTYGKKKLRQSLSRLKD